MRSWSSVARAISPVLGLFLGLGFAGCGEMAPVEVVEPSTDAATLYRRLMMNHDVITMSTVAPYDTLQLAAVPLNAAGEPMSGLAAPTFRSTDTVSLRVTPDGRLWALGTAADVRVIAELTHGNVRRADTAYVKITNLASPPRLARLSIQPEPWDSAVLQLYVTIQGRQPDFNLHFSYENFVRSEFRGMPTIRAFDSTGASMTDVTVRLTAPDWTIARKGDDTPTNLVGDEAAPTLVLTAGQARLIAQTTAYGITVADTAVWTIRWPTFATVRVVAGLDGEPRFTPNQLVIHPDGFVSWMNDLSDPMEVTFEDPTNVAWPNDGLCDIFANIVGDMYGAYSPGEHCGSGNLVIPGPGGATLEQYPPNTVPSDVLNYRVFWSSQLRQFRVPGVYRFRSTRSGATGQITVTTNPAGTWP